jgi:hypothetical protein
LAEGIAASAVPSDGSASAGNLPLTTTDASATNAQGESTTPSVAVPTTTGLFSDERKALRELGDEAHAAIAQAKGLIAFAAQAARSRKHRPDDDDHEFFRQLQQSVQDAAQDLDSALTEAGQTLAAAESPSGPASNVETSTQMVQMSVEVTVTANIVI